MNNFLEIVLSLLVVFIFFSALASAIVEYINSLPIVQKRQMYLLQSVMDAFNDSNGYSWGTLLYRQPAITALKTKKGRYPVYISASTFADAVLSMLRDHHFVTNLVEKDGKLEYPVNKDDEKKGEQLIKSSYTFYADVVNGLSEGRFKQLMTSFLVVTGDKEDVKLAAVKSNIQKWFDNYQDRISGEYRKSVQRDLFWYGLLIAAVLNINILTIIRAVIEDDGLRSSLVSQAEDLAKNSLDKNELICEDCTESEFETAYEKFLSEKITLLDSGSKWYASSGLPIFWEIPLTPKQRWIKFLQNKINALTKTKRDTVLAIDSRYCLLQAFSETSDSVAKAARKLIPIPLNGFSIDTLKGISDQYTLGIDDFQSLEYFWLGNPDPTIIGPCLSDPIKTRYLNCIENCGCIDRIQMGNLAVQRLDERIRNYELEIELYDEIYSFWDKNPIYRVFAIPAYNLRTASDLTLYIIGIVLMAFSGTISSTSWFQLLIKLVDIRNAGTKPMKNE